MMPFNRDRIYIGSVEAAAFRRTLNVWTWENEPEVRAIIEQLHLQPPALPAGSSDRIVAVSGGRYDGHIQFAFDAGIVLNEAPISGPGYIDTNYAFNNAPGIGFRTRAYQSSNFNDYVTLLHSTRLTGTEGRGIRFFDLLGGGTSVGRTTQLNQERVAAEIIEHAYATGSVPIDARPIALAVAAQCLRLNEGMIERRSTVPLNINLSFFNARNGMTLAQLRNDTLDSSREASPAEGRYSKD